MRFYLCFSTILVISNLIIQCWGRFDAHEGKKLGCSSNGYEWLYTTKFGELFITAHIVQIIMQAVMLEKALFKVPHEAGLFEAPKDAEFSESEYEHNEFRSVKDDEDDKF